MYITSSSVKCPGWNKLNSTLRRIKQFQKCIGCTPLFHCGQIVCGSVQMSSDMLARIKTIESSGYRFPSFQIDQIEIAH